MTQFSSMLGEWLNHIQSIMVGASWIAAQIVQESASVLVHCRFFFSSPASGDALIELVYLLVKGECRECFLHLHSYLGT